MLAWGGGYCHQVEVILVFHPVCSTWMLYQTVGHKKKIDCFINMLFFFDFIYQMFKLGHFQFHEK